jgi:UDP-glucose 4-epimerase
MDKVKVMLITGAATYWGARLAARLLAEPGWRVLGIDSHQPDELPAGLDFIQADVRNSLLAELCRSEQVDVVCHLAFVETAQLSESLFDLNVMGTMKLLGACAEAGVGKVVLKSSTAVYGAHPNNPAFLTENHPLRGSRQRGDINYLVEIEAFCNGFRRQSPHVGLAILRFANILGETADTPLTRLLRGPVAPLLLGFDPLMQLIHEDDVVEALAHAIFNDTVGVFNVAADGVMPLTRLLALTSAIPLPLAHPLAYRGAALLRASRANPDPYLPFEPDYLRYRWVADTRQMKEALAFYPRQTAEAAVHAFGLHKRAQRYGAQDALSLDEARLRETLARRRQAKEMAGR